jgi:hypothetical protein
MLICPVPRKVFISNQEKPDLYVLPVKGVKKKCQPIRRMRGGYALNATGSMILPKVIPGMVSLPEHRGNRSRIRGAAPNARSSSARREYSSGLRIKEVIVEPLRVIFFWSRESIPGNYTAGHAVIDFYADCIAGTECPVVEVNKDILVLVPPGY